MTSHRDHERLNLASEAGAVLRALTEAIGRAETMLERIARTVGQAGAGKARAAQRSAAGSAAAPAAESAAEPPRRARPPRQAVLRYLYRGRPMTVAELAEVVGCPYQSMYYRLRMHDVEQAVAMPYRARSAATGPAHPTHATPWAALDKPHEPAAGAAAAAATTARPRAARKAKTQGAPVPAPAPGPALEPAPRPAPALVAAAQAPCAATPPAKAPAKAPVMWSPGCAGAPVPPTPAVVSNQPRRALAAPAAVEPPRGATVTRAPAPRQPFADDQPPRVFSGRVGRYESTGTAIERAYDQRRRGKA